MTYFLTLKNGTVYPVEWDGTTAVTWPVGSSISTTPPAQTRAPDPSQDQLNYAADNDALAANAQTIYTALKAGTATSAQMQRVLAVLVRREASRSGIILT